MPALRYFKVAHDPVAPFKVVLSEHSVRVTCEENSVLVQELAEVFFCALELHPCPVQSVSVHEVTSP